MSMSMVRSFLSPFLLLHLLLLDLVEPAEDLVFKLLIHGVNKAGPRYCGNVHVHGEKLSL